MIHINHKCISHGSNTGIRRRRRCHNIIIPSLSLTTTTNYGNTLEDKASISRNNRAPKHVCIEQVWKKTQVEVEGTIHRNTNV